MQDQNPEKPRRDKGRPPAPFKFERLAIATCLANQGMTFKSAAAVSVAFCKYDPEIEAYVRDDEMNARLPGTAGGRRTALYQIRAELLASGLAPPGAPFFFNGKPLPIPVALRFDEPPQRGRQKKMRTR